MRKLFKLLLTNTGKQGLVVFQVNDKEKRLSKEVK